MSLISATPTSVSILVPPLSFSDISSISVTTTPSSTPTPITTTSVVVILIPTVITELLLVPVVVPIIVPIHITVVPLSPTSVVLLVLLWVIVPTSRPRATTATASTRADGPGESLTQVRVHSPDTVDPVSVEQGQTFLSEVEAICLKPLAPDTVRLGLQHRLLHDPDPIKQVGQHVKDGVARIIQSL